MTTTSPDGKRSWADLGQGERVAIGLLGTVQLALLGAALADLRRREAGELTAPRWLWTVISFVNFVGPLAYFAAGRRKAV